MAIAPEPIQQLDMQEQLARIDRMQTRLQVMMQETRLATPHMFFQGGLAMGALIAAGIMLVKVSL